MVKSDYKNIFPLFEKAEDIFSSLSKRFALDR